MTPEERANCVLTGMQASADEAILEYKGRIMSAIASAVFEERERCARLAEEHDKYDRKCYEDGNTGRCLAAQIRKLNGPNRRGHHEE